MEAMEGMDKYLLSKLMFTVLLSVSLSTGAALNTYSCSGQVILATVLQ